MRTSKRTQEAEPLIDSGVVVVYTEDEGTGADRNTESTPSEVSSDPGTKRQVTGAAVAGGLVGLVFGGPVLGLLAAGGSAAVATAEGKAGDVARTSGDAMADAGDRLRRFDEKHRVVDKTSEGIAKGCRWVSKRLEPKPSVQAGLTT